MTNVPFVINGCSALFGALLKVITARTPCIRKLYLSENYVINMFWKFKKKLQVVVVHDTVVFRFKQDFRFISKNLLFPNEIIF